MPDNIEGMDGKLKEQISKNWGNYCPSCGALKDNTNLKFLKKVGPASQFLSECDSCNLKTVITIVPNLGMQVTQLRTDISSHEFEKFSTPITSNDYLEFYHEIKELKTTEELIKLLSSQSVQKD